MYLIKNVSSLRATYQVRLLAFMAQKKGKKLVIKVPKGFKAAPSLMQLIEDTGPLIRIERT